MDIPTPPPDSDARNIIDKLAQFVARNGHEFEVMTKAKQKGNPKFSFLYGGEYFKYYQYKVSAEQALINRQGSTPQIPQNTPHQPSIPSSASANLAQWIAGNIQQPATVNPTQHFPSATPIQQTPSPAPYNSATDTSLEHINQQLSALRDQIQQSEQNLNAQHTVLLNQQQNQIEETVAQEQIDLVKSQAETCEIQLSDMDAILQPIIDTCTKDSISTGKGWILQNATTSSHASVISKYLLLKVINKTSNFIQKLHVIYLVNDVLYHCVRKKAEDLKKCFEEVVVPMFCNASTSASDEQRPKLDKLVKLWESKANYFEAAVVNQLKNPIESYQEYQREQVLKYMSGCQTRFDNYRQQHLAFVNHAMQQIQTLEVQRKALEIQKTAQEQLMSNAITHSPIHTPVITPPGLVAPGSVSQNLQNVQNIPPPPQISLPQNSMNMNLPQINPNVKLNTGSNFNQSSNVNLNAGSSFNQSGSLNLNAGSNFSQSGNVNLNAGSNFSQSANVNLNSGANFNQNVNMNLNASTNFNQSDISPPGILPIIHPPGLVPPGILSNSATILGNNPLQYDHGNYQNFNEMEENDMSNHIPMPVINNPGASFFDLAPVLPSFNIGLPDLSKPPPGFPIPDVLVREELMPSLPYFDLPAGLMVPLVKLEDSSFEPLDPKAVRLPPPAPPSERLLAAVELFYTPPSHERPRDSEGWEKLSLYEYYKAKNNAKKQKSDEGRFAPRVKSGSISPTLREFIVTDTIPRRRFRSSSRSRSRSHSLEPRSPSPIQAPQYRQRSPRPRGGYRKGSGGSASPARSPNPHYGREAHSPPPQRGGNSSRNARSPTPPSFLTTFAKPPTEQIGESNKGHQMLKRMGWGGTGLGSAGQGIEAPISGGHVRDRQDLYKGVGVNLNDPYESFRKNKGAAFITRMKARAETGSGNT